MLDLSSLGRSLNIFPRTLNYIHLANSVGTDPEYIKQRWASEFMERTRIQVEMINQPSLEPSILFVGNHISYVDIAILLKCVPYISFVAKKEVGTWPLIGSAAKKISTVFVDRQNKANRNSVRESLTKVLKSGRRIVVFPSGTTTEHETVKWKKGAFEVAKQGSFKIQPFRIDYKPLRDVAYIDNDILLIHLIKMSQKKTIQARLEFHEPVSVVDAVSDSEYWRNWTQQMKNKGF